MILAIMGLFLIFFSFSVLYLTTSNISLSLFQGDQITEKLLDSMQPWILFLIIMVGCFCIFLGIVQIYKSNHKTIKTKIYYGKLLSITPANGQINYIPTYLGIFKLCPEAYYSDNIIKDNISITFAANKEFTPGTYFRIKEFHDLEKKEHSYIIKKQLLDNDIPQTVIKML